MIPDFDECTELSSKPCEQNCHNVYASYSCSCDPGYIVSGKNCLGKINETKLTNISYLFQVCNSLVSIQHSKCLCCLFTKTKTSMNVQLVLTVVWPMLSAPTPEVHTPVLALLVTGEMEWFNVVVSENSTTHFHRCTMTYFKTCKRYL